MSIVTPSFTAASAIPNEQSMIHLLSSTFLTLSAFLNACSENMPADAKLE